MGAYDELDKFQTEEGRKIVSVFAAKALADEQQPADPMTAEQQQDEAVAAVQRFADAWRDQIEYSGHPLRDPAMYMATSVLGRPARMTEPQLSAVLAELDAPATRVAELEGEREADARAALALLKLGEVLYLGQRPTDWADARRQLIARFADRIEALAAAETEES